jgi:hypothetical protein
MAAGLHVAKCRGHFSRWMLVPKVALASLARMQRKALDEFLEADKSCPSSLGCATDVKIGVFQEQSLRLNKERHHQSGDCH